jgi:2-oxoglutarate ferredoxin oxidoreductase subunit gamma
MMKQYIMAGFGGQGIMFAGQFVANHGLVNGKHVSWFPSYGPEMRGGTANCSAIGSPVVSSPDTAIVMNLPSLEKFESKVKAGGTIYVDSSIVEKKVARTDIKVVYIPATRLANEIGKPKLANMVMLGNLLAGTDEKTFRKIIELVVHARHAGLIEDNIKALGIGINYKG